MATSANTRVDYNYSYVSFKFSGVVNALAAAGTLTLGTLPAGFKVIDSEITSEQGTTNNSLSVGDGTTAALYWNTVDISSAAVAQSWRSVAVGSGNAGTASSGTDAATADTSVVVKNVGSAVTPSSDKKVVVWLHCIRTF